MTDIQPYEATADMTPMTPVNKDVMENLKSYTEAWASAAQIAEQIARTDFAGPFKDKPQDMAVAILKGASLGIPPESIGKSIYVVHGTPALYGKTALAIALQNGYIAETIEDTPQAVTVRMTSPKGQAMEVRYTIERATQEGLVKGNKVQYETRPSKMLYWKCVGELTDRMIPHLTGGMPVKEDWEQSAPIKMTATRKPQPQSLQAALEKKSEPEPVDDVLSMTLAAIADAGAKDDLTAIMLQAQEQLDDEEYEQAREAANTRYGELNE